MPSRLPAALIMPLALSCLHARAQMVPVDDLPAPQPVASAAAPELNRLSLTSSSSAAPEGTGVQLPPPPAGHPHPHIGPLSTLAMGVTGGTLGAGVEFATPISRSLNMRFGSAYVNAQYPFVIDGVGYNTAMKLTSGQGIVDWYPKHGGFHLSAGALYLKSAVNASASIAAGQQFKLGGTTYLNSVDDPVQGTASLTFKRNVAPMVLIGAGNLIPRSGRHISIPFEIGGAYLTPPQVGIQLAGTACTSQGCFNTATDPSAQASLASEITKLNRDIRPLQIFPIVSIGMALRF